MLDGSIRTITNSILHRLSEVKTATAMKPQLDEIAEVLKANPYLTEFRNRGVDLAEDRDAANQAVTAHLATIFGLTLPDLEAKPTITLNHLVTKYLDRLMRFEVAHILNDDYKLREQLARNKSPVLLDARTIQASVIQKKLEEIEIPDKVLQQLNISRHDLDLSCMASSMKSYSFREILTILEKDDYRNPNLHNEIKNLALPTLWNLNRVYSAANNSLGFNPKLLDKLNYIVGNISLEQNAGILDQAAIVYYCIKHAQQAIKSDANLNLKSKETLLEITNQVIYSLLGQLKKSSYSSFIFNSYAKALKGLQEKVAVLDDDEFQKMTIHDLLETLYFSAAQSEESLDLKNQEFNEKVTKVKAAIDEQWENQPELKDHAEKVLLERIRGAKLTLVLANSDSALTELNTVLESITENCENLFLNERRIGDAFKSLPKYASPIEGNNPPTAINIFKDFLNDPSTGDLLNYLKLTENEVSENISFSEMRQVANTLKAMSSSIDIHFTSSFSKPIKKSDFNGLIICFGGVENIQESDLILNFEYMDKAKFDKMKTKQSVNFYTAIALAAQSLLDESLTKKNMIINDYSDPNLRNSIKDNDFIEPMDNIIGRSGAKKLLVTILGDNNELIAKPLRLSPFDKVPSPAAPVLPV